MAFDKDDLLEAIGLQERDSMGWMMPAVVGFGIGALVGAGVALLMAPKAGDELRDDLMERGKKYVEKGKDTINSMTGQMNAKIDRPST